jgi:tetratricopeptide (TPR) repeat protein
MRSRIKNLKMDPLPMPILIRMLGSTLLIFVCTGCIADIGNSLNASADPVHLAPAKRTESMKEKEYAQKIAKLSRRIDQNPRDAEALYQRAIAHLELNSIKESDGNWAQAEEDLTQVIQLDPKRAEAYYERGQIRGGPEGRQDLDRAIQLNPNFADAYARRGVARESEDLRGALKDFNQAIQLNPKNAWAYLWRSSVRHRLGDRKGALEDETKAVQVEPTAETFNFRAGFREGRGDKVGAIKDWTAAIALNPEDASSYYFRAHLYEETKNYSAALADIDQLRRIKQKTPDNVYPDVAGTYTWQAQIRAKMGNAQPEITDYTKAIQLQPTETSHYLNRAASRRKVNDYAGAIADYTQVIQLEPCNFWAYQSRADLRAVLKEYASAIADYSQALKFVPPSRWLPSDLYLQRGIAHAGLKQYQSAIADYSQAIQKNPKLKAAYLARATALEQLGNASGAKGDRQKAASLPEGQNTGEIIYGSAAQC